MKKTLTLCSVFMLLTTLSSCEDNRQKQEDKKPETDSKEQSKQRPELNVNEGKGR